MHGVPISKDIGIARRVIGKRPHVYDPELIYYSPHDSVLSVFFEMMMADAVAPYEILRVSASPDYRLSKAVNSDFRRKHNKLALNYGALENMDHILKKIGDQYVGEEKINASASFIANSMLPMDIISIRRRGWWRSGHEYLLLSDVIAELAKANLHYKRIHCNFCRAHSALTVVAPASLIEQPGTFKLGEYE